MSLRFLSGLLVAICLAGCSVAPGLQAFADAYHHFQENGSPDSSRLNPRFKYIMAQIEGHQVFMVLGYVDGPPDGAVEVWYSGANEVLRLRDGRIAGAILSAEKGWSSVSFAGLPRWDQVGEAASFERNRDVSPGYRYGIREKMHIRRIPVPADIQLHLIQSASLAWFEERAEGDEALPPARYGVNFAGTAPQVVYAEQCLFRDVCFSWQRWPVQEEDKH